ncbi:S-adenosyl-L-methionine-dependent methyltransferase [Cercophora scortea]|uniref:S-adenosyl-L-methionine-dependent methyltransferase n=1 Tax=Cercophora scortea TaxID=314031 RepID=A0AAE0I739_9PEZI|nr:S-adenosyl-L-methionine-dependent methyltransferase [Cercophora scortea]
MDPFSPRPMDIEVAEPGDTDSDEFYPHDIGSEIVAAAGSVTSSIFRHSFEHGRRYHSYKNSRYPIPNDDIEQDREELKHAMMLEVTDGKLFFAPIGDYPQKIIDLGTGTGLWAIEVADLYPSAVVQGIDFTPIQPVWVPSNLSFVVDDIEDEWRNGSDFDLVHIRQVFPVIKGTSRLIQQCFDNIKPGGWIEIQEFGGRPFCDDGSTPEDYSVLKFSDLATQAMANFGCDFRVADKLEGRLAQAGFTNISCRRFKVPMGTWPKDKRLRLVGLYFRTVFASLIDAMAAKPFAALNLPAQEINDIVAAASEDISNNKYHSYYEYLFWTAQKPY